MARFGKEAILFSDDEFVGDKRYAKDLLRAIIPVNGASPRPISMLTQSTVNAARDDELLELLADAGFAMLFVGIESVAPETLRNIGKIQNLKGDLVEDARHILEYGIAIRGNTIVGFDEDDLGCFDRLFDFHQNANIPYSAVTVLMAPHGTPLWARLRDEFEIRERFAALHGKLALISRTAETALEFLQNRRALRVEWAIVGLIVFEIVVALVQWALAAA